MVQAMGGVSSYEYINPFLGLGEIDPSNTGSGNVDGIGVTGATSVGHVGTEIENFRKTLETFSPGEGVEAPNAATKTVAYNPYAENQDLYGRMSQIGTGELVPNMDSEERRTIAFA